MNNPNILVIGNGFDLYHDLKTNYIDFVEFAKELTISTQGTKGRYLAISNSFVNCFIKVASENQSWIDCEKEIEIIVTMILKILYDRNVFATNSPYIVKDKSSLYSYEFERLKLMDKFCSKSMLKALMFREKAFMLWGKVLMLRGQAIMFRNRYFRTYEGIDKNMILETLKCDLNDLIQLFKYYLEEKVINQSVTKLSNQIENIKPDYVINFNYTNTYEHYGINRQDVCYIHGSVEDDNMVLGIRDIDEKDINSIHFKKFFQRIQKHTDIIQWDKFGVNNSLSGTERNANTYFFGHSLSNNDGDLIKNIYENSRKIIIFHMESQKDYEQKIINLIDTLGKESVIQGMYSGKIEFVPIK